MVYREERKLEIDIKLKLEITKTHVQINWKKFPYAEIQVFEKSFYFYEICLFVIFSNQASLSIFKFYPFACPLKLNIKKPRY